MVVMLVMVMVVVIVVMLVMVMVMCVVIVMVAVWMWLVVVAVVKTVVTGGDVAAQGYVGLDGGANGSMLVVVVNKRSTAVDVAFEGWHAGNATVVRSAFGEAEPDAMPDGRLHLGPFNVAVVEVKAAERKALADNLVRAEDPGSTAQTPWSSILVPPWCRTC